MIAVIVGARPNFIKAAPLLKVLKDAMLIHTGQHYDYRMSEVFFKELNIPVPFIHLGIGSGSHAYQTGKMMILLEDVFLDHKPNKVVVIGDVNSTLAGALAAAKLNIPIAHVEAGVRSYDMTQPEEVNRVIVDKLSTYCFTSSDDDSDNLRKEGITGIHQYGNILADTLLGNLSKIKYMNRGDYCLLTLHRPSNVDFAPRLHLILDQVEAIAKKMPVLFPVHPRTLKAINRKLKGIIEIHPQGYLDFIELEKNAKRVVTDSGGVQIETSILGTPCVTLLERMVWPITHVKGSNILCPDVSKLYETALSHSVRRSITEWDGHTAERIAAVLNA